MKMFLNVILASMVGLLATSGVANAAVDAAVTTALTTAATDGSTMGSAVLVVLVTIVALKYLRRSL